MGDFRLGPPDAPDTVDQGCCGKWPGCTNPSKGCLHKPEKRKAGLIPDAHPREPRQFWVIRYHPEVALDLRKHAQTLGRFETWVDADDERDRREHAGLLEAVGPRAERAS